MKCLVLVLLSEALSCSSCFPQNPFISSSFTRIFPLLNLLGQKDQGVKLGLRRDVKNIMGVATVGCGSLGLNDSIFLVPLNERDGEMVNLRSFTTFSQIKGNSFIHVWWSLSSSITVLSSEGVLTHSVFMHNGSFLEIQSDLNFFIHLILPYPFIFCSFKHREGPKNVLSVNIYSKEAPVNPLHGLERMTHLGKILSPLEALRKSQ